MDIGDLVAQAVNALVSAAMTDAWEAARSGFARLFRRGTEGDAAERKLDATRELLSVAGPAEVEEVGADQAAKWAVRLEDLLADHPGIENDLRTLVERIERLVPRSVSAWDGGFAAGGHNYIHADRSSVVIGQLVYHQHEAKGRPISLHTRPATLAGREELLTELHARLSHVNGDQPRLAALVGMGGTGKTSVAVEYAYRHLATAGIAWQFPAEDPAVLQAGFTRLAGLLGLDDTRDQRDPVASVHAVLAGSASPWLLVFDNVVDQASVRAYLPPAGNGEVLVTSQSALWPPGLSVEVPVLAPDVAADFLTGQTGDPDRRAAVELAVELGGLPLALEQAAAYVRETGGSLAGYLGQFQSRRGELLKRETSGSGKTVAGTWQVAFRALERESAEAVTLLRLLACCAPEPVPAGLIFQPGRSLAGRVGQDVAEAVALLLADPLAVSDAIAALRRYSLVTLAGQGLLLLHRLVQAITLDQMPAEAAEQWRQAMAKLLSAAIPADSGVAQAWSSCAALLPHALAVLAEDSDGMARMAGYLGHSGNYVAARDLWGKVFAAREAARGPDDPATLKARSALAYWTGEAGDRAGAREQYAQLLRMREHVLGADHRDTLKTRGSLAYWTGLAGDMSGARDQCAELLRVQEQVLGAEHPDTLSTRGSVAYWTGEMGDQASARDQLARLLPARQRILGEHHHSALSTRSGLAYWTGEAGDRISARDQLTGLLSTQEHVFGMEHPETLSTRHNLAHWTGEAGDAATARDLYTELLPVRKRVLGPDHPGTLTTRRELARWTGEAGDTASARDQLADLLITSERVLGSDHPETRKTRHSLAHWTGKAEEVGAN